MVCACWSFILQATVWFKKNNPLPRCGTLGSRDRARVELNFSLGSFVNRQFWVAARPATEPLGLGPTVSWGSIGVAIWGLSWDRTCFLAHSNARKCRAWKPIGYRDFISVRTCGMCSFSPLVSVKSVASGSNDCVYSPETERSQNYFLTALRRLAAVPVLYLSQLILLNG